MKKPKYSLCIYCKKRINLKNFGGAKKDGLFHLRCWANGYRSNLTMKQVAEKHKKEEGER